MQISHRWWYERLGFYFFLLLGLSKNDKNEIYLTGPRYLLIEAGWEAKLGSVNGFLYSKDTAIFGIAK